MKKEKKCTVLLYTFFWNKKKCFCSFRFGSPRNVIYLRDAKSHKSTSHSRRGISSEICRQYGPYLRRSREKACFRSDVHVAREGGATKERQVSTPKSRLYVQVGTQKFGRRTERDVQVKITIRITLCKVFRTGLYQLDVQTRGTYNWETYNWDSTVSAFD